MKQLSDERLLRLHYWARNLGTTEGDTAADAISELLGLRTKLAAGQVVLRLARRTAELSANIMRDINRTGGWEGAEKVARQFDRIASLLKEQLSDEQLRHE